MSIVKPCVAVAFFLPALAASGQQQVGFIQGEGHVFRVEVDFATFASRYSPQRMTQWCWAASISNVFAFHGHPVSQERIVKEVYGSSVNMPALSAITIARQINRRWVDDNGETFAARLTAAYDSQAKVVAINNAFLINELKAGRPVIICNTSHCMVTTAIDYSPVRVVGVGVFDPWPGKGARNLSFSEMLPKDNGGELTFLGSLKID